MQPIFKDMSNKINFGASVFVKKQSQNTPKKRTFAPHFYCGYDS